MQVVGCSIDSHYTHNAWRNTDVKDGGIGKVSYPLVADMNHAICKAYGVETPDGGVAFRGSFLIDKNGLVRHQVVNDLPLGRNIDEMLRMVDALQFTEEHGEVCPAGWQTGKKGMKASPDGVAAYLASEHKQPKPPSGRGPIDGNFGDFADVAVGLCCFQGTAHDTQL
ncbi:MAG: peroxiredoxin [Polyangiales bacterium]